MLGTSLLNLEAEPFVFQQLLHGLAVDKLAVLAIVDALESDRVILLGNARKQASCLFLRFQKILLRTFFSAVLLELIHEELHFVLRALILCPGSRDSLNNVMLCPHQLLQPRYV